MNKEQFWQIIDSARAESEGDIDEMADVLADKLSAIETPEIFAWHQIFLEYQHLSYKEKLWAAAYVINGGCGDDGFDYFRAWLTAQGKAVFVNALENPDSLADVDEAREDETEFEDMLSAASSAYFKKLNIKADYDLFYEELDKYPLSDTVKSEIKEEIVYAQDIDEEWDEDELETVVPKLYAKFD